MPFLDHQRWYHIHRPRDASAQPVPAAFLDRDGVIIVEKHYLREPEQVELYPGVTEKLFSLRGLGVPVVMVTNQSGIARGFFGWEDNERVHARIESLLGGNPFAAVYANAHHPSEAGAEWRKPNPGMLTQAAADLNIDLGRSVMVGDKWVDMAAASRAGVGRLVHVRTGHGASEEGKILAEWPEAEIVASLADVDFSGLTPRQRAAAP